MTTATGIDLETWVSSLMSSMEEVATTALESTWDDCASEQVDGRDQVGAHISVIGAEKVLVGVASSTAGVQRLSKNLLCMDSTEADLSMEDLADAFGEIANMVAGVLKTKLITRDPSLMIGLPACVEGQFREMSSTETRSVHCLVAGVPVALIVMRRATHG